MDDGPKKREEEEKEARLWKLRETFLRRRAESKISYKRRRRHIFVATHCLAERSSSTIKGEH